MRETQLHCRSVREIRRQPKLEENLLQRGHRVALQYQQTLVDQPHVEAEELLYRSETMIRADIDGRLGAHLVQQLADRRIDRVPVFLDSSLVGVMFSRVELGMVLVDEMPKLMLEAIGAPVMSRKLIPFFALHQVAIDLGFVFELGE